jgi:hypothetical protein
MSLYFDFGKVHAGEIRSIVCSAQSIFTSDYLGSLKQFSIANSVLLHDYGKLHDGGIENLVIEGKFLITSGRRGLLRQYE